MKRLYLMSVACSIVLLLFLLAPCQNVKRGRDEGTSSIPGSNVMGNGNITAFVGGGASYSLEGFSPFPAVGAQVGITDIMELSGRFVPWTKRGIGPIEAHLQITTPANDKLRFFGFALFADLFFSTLKDTQSQTNAKEKPEYNTYPSASLVADLDWLAFKKWLPLKTYLKIGLADNPDLLFKYDQIAASSAIEWKAYQHSLFVNAGIAAYKEKASKNRPGDASYAQRYAWIEPGGRYRFFSRFSLIGSVKISLYQDIKERDKSPLNPELFNVSLRVEAPVFFRETNAEAIRTLVFLEQRKEKKSETAVAASMTSGQSLLNNLGTLDETDTLGSFDYSQEREELIKRREETQRKMSEIEKLFLELDKADSLKMQGGPMMPPPLVRPDSTVKP
jgi:hypothetical protein